MTSIGVRSTVVALALIFAATGAWTWNHADLDGPSERPWEAIDLVVALDTSDSMTGLIDAARLTLWDLVNRTARAEPEPRLRVALLTYGNSAHPAADGWVRVDSDLTPDLDRVAARLFELETHGGKEYVARVLATAVQELDWTPSPEALKLIFVAGNEPADLDPEISLDEVAMTAAEAGISVHTVYCGQPDQPDARSWRELAERVGGRFAAIDLRGGTMLAETEYDNELVRLGEALNATFVPLGEAGRARVENAARQDRNTGRLSSAAAASRTLTKSSPRYSSGWDLISVLDSGALDLADIPAADLPPELRQMSQTEIQLMVEELRLERQELRRRIDALAASRRALLTEQAVGAGADPARSFEAAVWGTLRAELEAHGFQLPER